MGNTSKIRASALGLPVSRAMSALRLLGPTGDHVPHFTHLATPRFVT